MGGCAEGLQAAMPTIRVMVNVRANSRFSRDKYDFMAIFLSHVWMGSLCYYHTIGRSVSQGSEERASCTKFMEGEVG